ncbi:MAG: hypothetical protein U0R72_11160 [Nakamurella multipartita]
MQVPTTLTQRWTVATDPAIGAVASPYGVVVTGQGTAALAYGAITGTALVPRPVTSPLCARSVRRHRCPGVTVRGKVRSVMVVSNKDGSCSQVMLLDPATGDRRTTTAPASQAGGALASATATPR